MALLSKLEINTDVNFKQLIDSIDTKGLRIRKTFDSRKTQFKNSSQGCIFHESDKCDCYIVYILVFGEGEGPVTLVTHRIKDEAYFTIESNDASPPSTFLIDTLIAALQPYCG